jgi:hypothetical protein
LTATYRITEEEFTAFYSEFITKDQFMITESDFAELISKYEEEVLQMAGID